MFAYIFVLAVLVGVVEDLVVDVVGNGGVVVGVAVDDGNVVQVVVDGAGAGVRHIFGDLGCIGVVGGSGVNVAAAVVGAVRL